MGKKKGKNNTQKNSNTSNNMEIRPSANPLSPAEMAERQAEYERLAQNIINEENKEFIQLANDKSFYFKQSKEQEPVQNTLTIERQIAKLEIESPSIERTISESKNNSSISIPAKGESTQSKPAQKEQKTDEEGFIPVINKRNRRRQRQSTLSTGQASNEFFAQPSSSYRERIEQENAGKQTNNISDFFDSGLGAEAFPKLEKHRTTETYTQKVRDSGGLGKITSKAITNYADGKTRNYR